MRKNCKRDAAEALPLPARDYCPIDLQVTERGKEGEGAEDDVPLTGGRGGCCGIIKIGYLKDHGKGEINDREP
jgi:hypothetical protein